MGRSLGALFLADPSRQSDKPRLGRPAAGLVITADKFGCPHRRQGTQLPGARIRLAVMHGRLYSHPSNYMSNAAAWFACLLRALAAIARPSLTYPALAFAAAARCSPNLLKCLNRRVAVT